MFTKLDDLYNKKEDENFEKKISELTFFEMNLNSSEIWKRSNLIENIALNLYLIDAEKIIDLPRSIFYSILTNDKLTIESEDSLLDLIDKFFNKEEIQKEDDGLSEIDFYEEVNFEFLSENKFKEFIENVDPNKMTVSLWRKIKKCFYIYKTSSLKSPKSLTKRDGNGFYCHNKQRYATSIIVGGFDKYHQICEKPNSKDSDGDPIIHPPYNLSFDSSSLLSYSTYCRHSVVVTRSGSLLGVGDNKDGRISSSLPKSEISKFTEFSMNDSSGNSLVPLSAVCTYHSTLYMFTKSSNSERQLILCDDQIDGPVFLGIGNHKPMSLFGGYSNSAAICTNGEIIFINRLSVKNSPSSPIVAFSLPDDEKAISVVCLENSVFALSSSGRVFVSEVKSESCTLKFSAVSELEGQKIIWMSGTYKHCLVVSNELVSEKK